MPGRAQGVRAAQRADVAGRAGRVLLVAVLAAACALSVTLPEAAAQEPERPRLGDLLPPLGPDDAAEDSAPPATTPPADPGPDPGPAPDPAPDPNEAPPPPPEGGPAPEAAPPAADVQGAEAGPRRPTSGSASGPGLQAGGIFPGESGAELPLEVAPPAVAPPDVAGPEAAPPADAAGQDMASQQLAAGSGAYPGEPAIPDLTVLGLLALGLMWFDRRYRARYRLPPQ